MRDRGTRRLVTAMLCSLAALLLASCKHGPDASTPKKAAAIFATAARAGDIETLHQVATGTDAEFELVKGLGQMTRAFGQFSAAASARFGTAGNTKGMSIDIANEFDSAEEKIDGDSAVLVAKSENAEESEPVHLKKEGPNWKVDLSFLDRDATAKEMSEKMPAIAKVWERAAGEVDAGKFETFPQARAAVTYRITVARLGEAAGRVIAARSDLASFENALDLYKNDAGEFPSTADGLMALMQKPSNALNWHGPYLKNTIQADPWGHAYIYVCPGPHNTNAYDLHSIGPDGKEGTADDIDNWSADAGK